MFINAYRLLSALPSLSQIWLREVVSRRDFILRAVATLWAMSLVGIYPGRASLTVLARISERRCKTFFIREFISNDVSERRKSNGSGLFAILSNDFEPIFGANRLCKSKVT